MPAHLEGKTAMIPSTAESGQRRRRSAHTAILLWPLTVEAPLARQARRLLETALIALPAKFDNLDDALFMVNEVASNAEAHACPPYELRVYHTHRRTVVEFADGDCKTVLLPSSPIPEVTLGEIDSTELAALEHGRGLLAVVALSQGDCGIRHLKLAGAQGCGGKVIWFAVPQ